MELARVLRAVREGTFFFFTLQGVGDYWDYPAANAFGNVVETASIDLVMKGESVDLTRGDSNIFFRVKRRGVSDREQEGRPSSGAS